MKKTFTVLVLILMTFAGAVAQTNPITTFILVRHAEKADDGTADPDLKPEGFERAKQLAWLLKNTSLDAVYSTKYRRTKNTVAPVAQGKGLEVQFYESIKPEVLDGLITKHAGGTILIGGHSNTTPQIANFLIGKEEFAVFPDNEYGNILIISVAEKGKNVKIVKLNY
jgi:phosphohistidine phosphatase SixA